MADYPLYMSGVGISRKDAIDTLNNKYPRFGKPTMAMICNPADYGVELTREAEQKLVDAFGWHAGLAYRRRRSEANRKKKNKLTVRLDDSLFEQMMIAYHRTSFSSVQDFIEAAIVEFINRRR